MEGYTCHWSHSLRHTSSESSLAVGSRWCQKLQRRRKREPCAGKDEAYKPREYHMGACAVPRRYLDMCEWDGWPVQQKYHVQASYGAAGA
jgi:hypothetical protein